MVPSRLKLVSPVLWMVDRPQKWASLTVVPSRLKLVPPVLWMVDRPQKWVYLLA